MRSLKNSGIYELRSPSGKRYVGSSKNLPKRKREHFSALSRGDHPNKTLLRAFNKYGTLTFSVLIKCSEDNLFLYEQFVIDGLRPEYNESPSACGTRGLKWSDESRARIKGKRSRDGARIRAGMLAALTPEERSSRHVMRALAGPRRRKRRKFQSCQDGRTAKKRKP